MKVLTIQGEFHTGLDGNPNERIRQYILLFFSRLSVDRRWRDKTNESVTAFLMLKSSELKPMRHDNDFSEAVLSLSVSLTASSISSLSMGFVSVRVAPNFLAPSR